jgi:hypothetical protein
MQPKEKAMTYSRTQQIGGDGGNTFSDNLTEICRLVEVKVRHGSTVDAITCVWTTPSGSRVTGDRHGGGGGSESVFSLLEGEHIVEVSIRSRKYVDSLTFRTNTGRTSETYGGSGGSPTSLTNLQAGGFFGRSGSRLDAIGVFTEVDC